LNGHAVYRKPASRNEAEASQRILTQLWKLEKKRFERWIRLDCVSRTSQPVTNWQDDGHGCRIEEMVSANLGGYVVGLRGAHRSSGELAESRLCCSCQTSVNQQGQRSRAEIQLHVDFGGDQTMVCVALRLS